MELKELTHDEKLACLAVMELFVMSNPAGSDEEAKDMAELATVFGVREYRKLLDEAEERFEIEEDFKQFLSTIKRQEARDLIYETVLECALEDGVEPQESDMLEWLSNEWKIRVEFDRPTEFYEEEDRENDE